MKKLFYFVGAFVTLTAIFAGIAIMLKKLKISLSIEGIDDNIGGEDEYKDIDLTIEDEKNIHFDETEAAVEEALEEMLSEEDVKEIEVEISEE